jgi:hypothetical protein
MCVISWFQSLQLQIPTCTGRYITGIVVEVQWGEDAAWCRGEMAEMDMASGASIIYPDSGETEQVSVDDLLRLARSGHICVRGRLPKQPKQRGRPRGDGPHDDGLPEYTGGVKRLRLEELVGGLYKLNPVYP